jgi:hypothetical protein
MNKLLVKTAFWLATVVLMLVFLVPAQFLLEIMLPRGDRVLVGTIVAVICLVTAGRITSYLFQATHITDERLSVFGARRQRGSGS